MGSKKKDLEIIYNLQWKNKPANGGDKANIIGMYDVPTTTLNWEIFKSYLLKNSGTIGDDVKVSYITDSNKEFPIESQTDFQVALYAFRRKARIGDIVNLKLDRISDQPTYKNNRHSNDAETQFDNEAVSLSSTCCNTDTPPEWFITYMGQFKKTITDELTTTLANIVSNFKPHTVSQPSCYHTRKAKTECPKRMRKLPTLIGEPHETKDVIKSLKLESKLERKLEKLEHKTKKIKEKKLALLTKSSDSDAGQSSSRSHSYRPSEKDDLRQFDAAPVNTQTIIPHMLGGEIYLHKWDVMNTGKLPWTSETTLNFTWGAKALRPLDSIIPVPLLKPGESGILVVRLQIPHQPGQYECYWHFHHRERRFGHWLGCQVIVDPFDLKGANSVLETSFMSEFISNPKKFKANDQEYDMEQAVTQYSEIAQNAVSNNVQKCSFNIKANQLDEQQKPEDNIEDDEAKYLLDRLVTNISMGVKDIKLQDPTDTNCSSDSDNQSIISLSESNSSKSIPDEFVVVPIPDCFKIDQAQDVSNEINVEQSNNDCAEIVVDPIVRNISEERSTQVLETENLTKNIARDPDNYDNNNNAEEANQNPSTSGSGNKVEDDASSCDGSQKSDIIIVSLPNEKEQADAGYAYVLIDGQKVPIPKKMLKSEYLKSAEEASLTSAKDGLSRTDSSSSSVEFVNKEMTNSQEKGDIVVPTEQENIVNEPENKIPDQNLLDCNVELLSHCSAAGSCFSDAEQNPGLESSSRLFIFPQNCPGFEVHVAEGPLSSPPLNLSTHSRNPFAAGNIDHIPNFQQTPPNMRTTPPGTPPTVPIPQNTFSNPPTEEVPHRPPRGSRTSASGTTTPGTVRCQESAAPVHILPETLVSGAVNVASSAINTARSVINMIVTRETPVTTNDGVLQQPGRWVNGHWISTNPQTPREANLHALAEMGFWNRDLNATLLARYNDDLSRVVAELVQ